jgi:superfamily I DNA and/or RNA helicase
LPHPLLLQQVIIVSTVRANPGARLGFVTDRRRMNVALTRAVRALILVGHESTLAADELWGSWMRLAARMQ